MGGAYQAALRESQNDKSGEKTFGARFLLRYDGAVADPETAHAMVAILDEEFSRISLQLGCRADERIVTIVESRDAFLKTTGAPGWSGGGYDGKIRIPILDRKQPAARERQVFAHELVHACLANIGAWPAWLHEEGPAQRLSGEPVMPGAPAAGKGAGERREGSPSWRGWGRIGGTRMPLKRSSLTAWRVSPSICSSNITPGWAFGIC